MLHANLAYRLPIPTELDKLNNLIKANIENRRFRVDRISSEAENELRALGYKINRSELFNQYEISW